MGHRGRIGIALLVALVAAGGLTWRASDDGDATSVRTSGQVAELADGPSRGGEAGGNPSDPAAPPSATSGNADHPAPHGPGAPNDDEFVSAGRRPTTTTTTHPSPSGPVPEPEPGSTTTTGPGAETPATRDPHPSDPHEGPHPPTTRPPTTSTTTTRPTGPTTTTTVPRPDDPGDRTLVYSKEVGPQQVRLFTGHVDGSHERPLTSGPNDQFPAWSPDGSTIVFTRYNADGYSQLWTIRPDGSGLRQLTTSGAEDKRDAAWSPDGRFVAFTGFYKTTYPYAWSVRIVVLELANGVMTDVSPGDFDSTPVWSPDSTTLVYRTLSPSREDYELWRVTRQGTDRRPVISAPANDGRGQDYWPAGWSADGSRILVYEQNSADDGAGYIITLRPDGTGRQQIMSDRQPFPGETGSGTLQFLTWSPDEQSVVFFTAQGLRYVNIDNTDHRMLDPQVGEYQKRWQADWAPF